MAITAATIRWIVVVSTLTVVMSGCGDNAANNDAPAVTATSAAATAAARTASEILSVASDRLDATQALHFNLDIEGTTYIDSDKTIQILSAEGNLKRPDRVQASFAANLLGRANVTIRIITVGAVTWWTDLVSGAWAIAPPDIGYDGSVLFDDTAGLAPVLRGFSSAERVGTESIDGKETYRLSGSMPRSAIDDVTAGTLSGETVNVQVWVDMATDNIIRVVVAESDEIPAADRATWTLDISRHDEPITIDPPI